MVAETEKKNLFEEVVARIKGRLLFLARQYASTDEVMDLYQEIMRELWESLDGFEGRSAPATWACRIATNTAMTYRRNNSRRERACRAYAQNVQSEQRSGRCEEEILREFAQSLSDTDRELFELYLTNSSYQQIAEASGISELNLRAKICRLRSQFEQRYL